ncbi:MAG: histidine phosphatase family protein [Myxococcota bacterium]|nr:histidine phosphatase family protein [Myxococcota bacterium]
MELVFVRHGLPERIERKDGQPADPPLAPEGVEQARRVADWLAGSRIDAILCSPMRRARETAAPLAALKGLDIVIEPDIREVDAESDSYIPLEELKAQDYEAWKRTIAGGLYAAVDPLDFQREVVAAIERTIEAYRGGSVAVVCHGGVINAWAAHVLGIGNQLFLDAGYTSVHRFFAASTGERSVASLNETAHLRSDVLLSPGRRSEDAA